MDSKQSFIVGIGASAGGQVALKEFFKSIPSDLDAAFVVVTHLFRDFKTELPAIVSRFTSMKVNRLTSQTRPLPGNVYVMPEDVLASMNNGRILLTPRPTDNLINDSINVFFKSLATDQKKRAIGVILSGMGSDGADGAVEIFRNGGNVLVQDPGSTKFSSMPIAAIMKDHPDFILPPDELGIKLSQLIQTRSFTFGRKETASEEKRQAG